MVTHQKSSRVVFGAWWALGVLLLLMPPCAGRGRAPALDTTGYLNLSNKVSAAGLGDSTNLGSWWFGNTGAQYIGQTPSPTNPVPTNPGGGDPTRTDDDSIWLVKKAGAALYVQGASAEFPITGGTGTTQMVSAPQIDVNSQSGGFTWKTSDPMYSFTVTFHMWLVRDVLRWEYDITNNTANARQVGFRTWEDVDWVDHGGGPYIVPNKLPSQLSKEWGGPGEDPVPSEWDIRYSPAADPPSAPDYKPLLRAKQPLNDGWVTTPDRLVVAEEALVTTYGWQQILTSQLPENYNTPPTIVQGNDLVKEDSGAVDLIYPLTSIQPGATQAVRGEIRFNWSACTTIGQYAVSAMGPEWVGYLPGPDPTDSTTTVGHYNPSTVTVHGYLCNSGKLVNPLASVSIDVGNDCTLASGSITYTGDQIAALDDKDYQWQVHIKPTAKGQIPIRVTATFTPGGTATSVWYINVPAIPAQTLPAGTALNNYDFVGFPFSFTDATANVALGIGTGLQLAWYDPAIQDYRYAADETMTLEAGRSYWTGLKTGVPTALTLQNASPLDQRQAVSVQLGQGWNAISNPYQFSIIWGYCQVLQNGVEMSIADAITNGLIRSELWSWDTTNGIYSPPSNPIPTDDLGFELQPFTGYWLYTTSSLSLIYEPNPFLPTMDPATPAAKHATRAATNPNNWQVNLVTETDNARDPLATFGVSSADDKTRAAQNVMKPPVSPNGLSTYFPQPNLGRFSGAYATVLQAPAASNSWTVEVLCKKPNERVTVRWPNLTQLPATLPLMLTDVLTGKMVAMRTASGYTFNSGTGGVRRFTIAAGGTVARLQFSQTSAVSTRDTGGAAITFATSVPAQVQVSVRTMTGRLVRTLTATETAGTLASLRWDGRDAQGRVLPSGVYLCELYAESQDGQRVRGMLTVRTR